MKSNSIMILHVFQQFRYLLQCSVPSYKESTSHKKEKVKVIKFDLEICLLPRLDMLGEPILCILHVP